MTDIYFPKQNRIYYHCRKCDVQLDITKLVKYLRQYKRNEVPIGMFKAWKILVTGSPEYEAATFDTEHQVIVCALENLLE